MVWDVAMGVGDVTLGDGSTGTGADLAKSAPCDVEGELPPPLPTLPPPLPPPPGTGTGGGAGTKDLIDF